MYAMASSSIEAFFTLLQLGMSACKARIFLLILSLRLLSDKLWSAVAGAFLLAALEVGGALLEVEGGRRN